MTWKANGILKWRMLLESKSRSPDTMQGRHLDRRGNCLGLVLTLVAQSLLSKTLRPVILRAITLMAQCVTGLYSGFIH